jgi:iron complex transport system ATP-binding protein
VITVMHDLSLARLYGTHALLMDRGRCVSQGIAGEVLTRENLQEVYRMDVYDWMQKMFARWTGDMV